MIAYLWFEFEESPMTVWVMYHNDEYWINYVKEDPKNNLNDEQIIFKMREPSSNCNKVTKEDALFNLIFNSSQGDGNITLLCDEKTIVDIILNDCIQGKRETRESFDKMCSLLKHICNSEDDIGQLNSTILPKEIVNMITKLQN